jgi:hypothetical protein
LSDLFSHQPARVATLADYLVDLEIKRLPDAQLRKNREAGEYRNLRPQDLTDYHQMARGRR